MVIGSSQKYYQKWRFRVLVDGIPGEAFFRKAGPLEAEVAVAEYKGGGAIIPHKEAASGKFPPITLERGSTDDLFLYNWFKNVLNAVSNSGEEQSGYKRNITIFQLDRIGNVVKEYNITDAFIVKYTAGDWDGTSDDFNLNVIEIEYAFFEENLAAIEPV